MIVVSREKSGACTRLDCWVPTGGQLHSPLSATGRTVRPAPADNSWEHWSVSDLRTEKLIRLETFIFICWPRTGTSLLRKYTTLNRVLFSQILLTLGHPFSSAVGLYLTFTLRAVELCHILRLRSMMYSCTQHLVMKNQFFGGIQLCTCFFQAQPSL